MAIIQYFIKYKGIVEKGLADIKLEILLKSQFYSNSETIHRDHNNQRSFTNNQQSINLRFLAVTCVMTKAMLLLKLNEFW